MVFHVNFIKSKNRSHTETVTSCMRLKLLVILATSLRYLAMELVKDWLLLPGDAATKETPLLFLLKKIG